MAEDTVILTEFERDVLQGLSSTNKYLSSKYFYNEQGSKIFRDIMDMPEYYLTDCELEILENQKENIIAGLGNFEMPLEVVELGAGDGSKTKILLKYLLDQKLDFKYIPIDISPLAVHQLLSDLENSFSGLTVEAIIGDYFKHLKRINGSAKKMVLFLGSNIGNFTWTQSLDFLGKLNEVLNREDYLLIGFDLKKNPEIILNAYDDPHNYTAAFNLNLLHRINEEMEADFNTDAFYHHETYNDETGTAKSYLVSKKPQSVWIGKLNKSFSFRAEERIFMEQSQKYDEKMVEELAQTSGFEIVSNYFDSRHWYVNSLWRVKNEMV